jgi:acetylornithine/N-succinyldiaminopimelate aminotransferase
MNALAEIPVTLMTTYGRAPVAFVKGEGNTLIDSEGRRYLDAVAGIAVNALGHSHPGFIKAMREQLGLLVHVSNLFRIPQQEVLSALLCEKSGMKQAFFCNSGAEAIEASIKLARKIGHARGLDVPTILVMTGAFHGRTLGALTATHSAKYQEGFGPLPAGFERVTYNDLEAAEAAIKANPQMIAVMVEPIQGEGGVVMPTPGYIRGLRALCDQYNLLLILDEIQTGNGRTGRYFAYQHENVLPDILATAKGLGNGYPIGACLAAGPAAGVFQPGNHGTTFGGSPLACTAGIAVYAALEAEKLVDNAAIAGKHILESLRSNLQGLQGIREIRGLGLMVGIEFDRDATELAQTARDKGLLLNIAVGTTIRLVPPLTLSRNEADFIIETVTGIVKEFCHDA